MIEIRSIRPIKPTGKTDHESIQMLFITAFVNLCGQKKCHFCLQTRRICTMHEAGWFKFWK